MIKWKDKLILINKDIKKANFLIILLLKSEQIKSLIINISQLTRYLVDPASSHMLVLKIKPCKPKFKVINRNCGWLIKSVIINLVKILVG